MIRRKKNIGLYHIKPDPLFFRGSDTDPVNISPDALVYEKKIWD